MFEVKWNFFSHEVDDISCFFHAHSILLQVEYLRANNSLTQRMQNTYFAISFKWISSHFYLG